jgi:lactate permease
MDMFSFLLCWSPVLLLTVLAVFLRRPALDLSLYGCLFTLALVVFYYDTPVSVALLAALDGAVTTLPLTLVVFGGIMLSSLLMATGSLGRIVDWLKIGVRDSFHRGILIAVGVGNFTEGAGVIAEPVVAPMLLAAGAPPAGAAALSIVGYAGLMTLEMAGVIIDVLTLVTGLPRHELGLTSAWLSVPAMLAMAACVPLFLDSRRWPAGPAHLTPIWSGPGLGAGRWALVLGSGLAASLAVVAVAAFIGDSIAGMLGGLALMALLVLLGSRRLPLASGVARDLAPFALVLVALLLLNTVAPLKEITARKLAFTLAIIPVHNITLAPLHSGYLYLFAAFGLAAWLLKVPGELLRQVLKGGTAKGWRAFIAMSLFGAMGQMIAYSGYTQGFASLEAVHNIPMVLAQGVATYTGGFYPIFVPILGWVGTFLTGYGVASLMLFGQLQVASAGVLGVSATWLASGLAVGASLGSISSPFKIAIAAPMCGAVGQEGDILRLTIPLGVGASLLVGLVLWLGVPPLP